MSTVIVFRETKETPEQSMRVSDVTQVTPFGANAVAFTSPSGTTIIPLGRIKQIFCMTEEDEEEAQEEVEIYIPQDNKVDEGDSRDN